MPIKKFAHRSTINNNGGGRVKFRYADADRYIDLDVTNVDQSVAEQLKSVVSTLSGRVTVPSVRTLNAAKTAAVVPEIDDQEDIPFPAPDEAQEEDAADQAASEPSGSSNGSKRTYNFKPPKFMDDLDFSKASKSLEDFMAESGNPTEMMDKYLVAIVWFKDYMNIDEITVHHIYTAFDHAGWQSQMPVNPTIPLRDLKTKRHMLSREAGAEGYKLNFKGIQHVGKMKK